MVERRTGIRLATSTRWPAGRVVIAITSETSVPGWGRVIPVREGAKLPEARPEGCRLHVESGPLPLRWWDEGKSRARLSWQTTMWPPRVVYEGLDRNATYVVRSTGYGQALLRINGERVEPTVDGKEMGEFKEFPVAAKYIQDRRMVLTWDRPVNEQQLNWRRRSRLAEVWLLKQ